MTAKQDVAAPRQAAEPSDAMSLARRHCLGERVDFVAFARRIKGKSPAAAMAEAIAIGYVLGYADGRDESEDAG